MVKFSWAKLFQVILNRKNKDKVKVCLQIKG
jgi:hypothetical protein